MDFSSLQETTKGNERNLQLKFNYYYFEQISKRDVDLFVSQELLIPPSCCILMYGKEADDTEELLSYSVGLIGIDPDSEEICINHFLETTGIVNYVFYYINREDFLIILQQ